MRILILTQFFWPEMRTAPTNLAALARDLKGRDHEVLVVTGFPNHPFGRIYEGYNMRAWQYDKVHGVNVLRLPLYPDHSVSSIGRMVNYGSFALSACTLGLVKSYRFRPDVIFAYFAPLTMGAAAAWLKRIMDVPMAYWITDLWPENLRAAGVDLGDLAFEVVRCVEDWSYRQAEAICVDSPGFRNNLIAKKVPAYKIHVIPEWADEELFYPVEPDIKVAYQYGMLGKFNIVYGGNLGTVQRLGSVIEAAELLKDVSDLQFVFVGDGNDMINLKQQANVLGLRNVCFIPRQPIEKIHKFLSLADVLLVHLKREPIFELQLPSKIIAYLACGRPILCAVPGAAATVVSEAGAGLTCPSENPVALAEMVRKLYNMRVEEREALGDSGRRAYLSRYTREVAVAKIEAVLQGLGG